MKNIFYKYCRVLLEIVIIALIFIIFFKIKPDMVYSMDYELWVKLGENIKNNDNEIINWIYKYGYSSLWVNHESLSCYIMYTTDKISKVAFGVITYTIFCIVITLNYFNGVKKDIGVNFIKYILIMPSMILSTITGFARPAALAVILFAVYIIVLCNIDYNSFIKNSIRITVLLVLWSLIHGGSYPISIVAMVCILLNSKSFINTIKYIMVWLVNTLVLLIIPFTRNSITYGILYHGNTDGIQEWNSVFDLGKSSVVWICLIAICLLGYIYSVGLKNVLHNWGYLVLLTGTLVMGFLHIRYFQYLGIELLILSVYSVNKYKCVREDVLNILLPLISVLFIILCINIDDNTVRNNSELLKEVYGTDINENDISIIINNSDLKIYNSMLYDNILIENDIKTFIDGRIDNLNKGVYEFTCDNSVENLSNIRDYGVELLLLTPNDDIADRLVDKLGDACILSNHRGSNRWTTIIRINYH